MYSAVCNVKHYTICIHFVFKALIFQTSALKKRILEAKDGRFMEKDKRILEELKSLHCDPHPYFTVFPSQSDFSKWLMIFVF